MAKIILTEEEEIIAQEKLQRKMIKKMRRERPFDDEPQKKRTAVCKSCGVLLNITAPKGCPCAMCGNDPFKKPKKEKVFKLKKDHIICPECDKGKLPFVGDMMCGNCDGTGQFKPKKEKIVKSESEIVHAYAKRVMDGKKSRGHVDDRFLDETKAEGTVNKELWRDQDFFVGFIFESKAQKYEFMAAIEQKFNFEFDELPGHQIQIANGYRLAGLMGIVLRKEEAQPYPGTSLDLLPLVLDNEAL